MMKRRHEEKKIVEKITLYIRGEKLILRQCETKSSYNNLDARFISSQLLLGTKSNLFHLEMKITFFRTLNCLFSFNRAPAIVTYAGDIVQ